MRICSICLQSRFRNFPQAWIAGTYEDCDALRTELTCHFKPNPFVRSCYESNFAFVFQRHAVYPSAKKLEGAKCKQDSKSTGRKLRILRWLVFLLWFTPCNVSQLPE
jgi:hypothetical protein